MSDITISLLIILIAGAAIALLFLFIRMRKKKKEQALADYCREHGYSFSRTKEALGIEVHVESVVFLLVSNMKAAKHLNAPTGSSQWHKETTWTARTGSGELPGFTLGSVSAGGNWSALADWIKNAAVEKLAAETGLSLNPALARAVHTHGKADFLLFEQIPGEGSAFAQKLGSQLDSWPVHYNLVVSSGPQGLQLRAAGLFIEDVSQLERVLRLGEACLEASLQA